MSDSDRQRALAGALTPYYLQIWRMMAYSIIGILTVSLFAVYGLVNTLETPTVDDIGAIIPHVVRMIFSVGAVIAFLMTTVVALMEKSWKIGGLSAFFTPTLYAVYNYYF